MATEADLVDELTALAARDASTVFALSVVREWTAQHDRSSLALKRALDVAFGRFASAADANTLLTVVGWLEDSHDMWGPR